MITNFQISAKTRRPACCDWWCCGNMFGRIERSQYAHIHGNVNRVKLSRRYVKHVEKQIVRREIALELLEI